MRFKLADSPFRNIHKYHDDDLLGYLEGHLREHAWHHHAQRKTAEPPSAYVFGPTQGSFVFGFTHPTPGAFIEQVKYEARHLDARRVVLLAEVNSLSAPDEAALLAVEVQAPGARSLRYVYDLLRPGRMRANEDWTFELPDKQEDSRLVGVAPFFKPVFVNPSDSAPA